MESELWLAHFVKLLLRFCYTTLVLSLNRTKPKALGFLVLIFSILQCWFFSLQYFPFFKIWWLSSSWACKYSSPVPSISTYTLTAILPSLLQWYSLVLPTLFWPCFFASYLSCPISYLSHAPDASDSTCVTSLGIVPHTLTLSWQLLLSVSFFLYFPVPFSPEGEGFLCYILPFVLYFLLFTFFSALSFYYWRNEISVALCLIARSWFFVFSQYKGIPAISLYCIVFCTAKPKSDPHNSCFVNLLNLGSKR